MKAVRVQAILQPLVGNMSDDNYQDSAIDTVFSALCKNFTC